MMAHCSFIWFTKLAMSEKCSISDKVSLSLPKDWHQDKVRVNVVQIPNNNRQECEECHFTI